VAPWFMMRHVFYIALGALLRDDGYEVVHAGAIDLDNEGILLVGSPGSGKTTLLVSCLQAGMKFLGDDIVLLAKDNGIVKVYSFPEDIGVRRGTVELLCHYSFMQELKEDVRHKRFIDVQRYFREQVSNSCQVSFLLFVSQEQRSEEFHAERLSPSRAVNWLMSEYISRQLAQDGGASDMFGIFSDMVTQAQSYRVTLTPDEQVNAEQVRKLITQHEETKKDFTPTF
jgi:serine kinase of HPr protein (carbohydrate metabolism regulator)